MEAVRMVSTSGKKSYKERKMATRGYGTTVPRTQCVSETWDFERLDYLHLHLEKLVCKGG